MKRSDFGDLMKTREAWASSEVPEVCWPIVRVDGRGFSGLTEARYRKPFDEEFAGRMRLTAVALLGELGGVIGYTQSDEISIVLPPDWSMFNRRAEKAASVAAGMASASFSLAQSFPAVFDGRLSTADDAAGVVDYLSWRVDDGVRNAVHSAAYWSNREIGHSGRAAESQLRGLNVGAKRALLEERGVTIPAWAAGSLLWWETVPAEGFNPITGETVPTTRRRVTVRAVGELADWRELAKTQLEATR
jgi:tRNA(His) guanylyltransferase